MAVNLYDYANQLEQALRDSDEYKAIKDAFAKVKENEESKKLFDEFRETQMSFQQKQMQGEEIPEEDLQKAQEQAQAIAKDENITIDIIEDEGESIGQHPNCAYIKANTKDGRYIEVIGISIGGGTIKLKGINVNGLNVELNHGLPMLVIDGNMNKAKINHLINDLSDMDLDLGEELIETNDNEGLVVFPLNKAISESALNIIKDKHSDLNVSYIK